MSTTHLRALGAVVRRNLVIALRRPDLLVQTMAVPLVVLGLASVIFGATDAWPIAVIDNSHTARSRALVQAIGETRGVTGPYFRTITTDPVEAEDMLARGRLQLVVSIPREYSSTDEIRTQTFNINTDAMKNVRLRLSAAANLDDRLTSSRGVLGRVEPAPPLPVTRTAFMGGSAVILALLLGSALVSANLYALDTEHRARKEVALTPIGPQYAGGGAALAGSLLSLLTALPTLALAVAFGTRATAANVAQASAVVVPAVLAAAGVGVLAAVGLRTHRLIQPTIILLALGSYFASGGFTPVNGLPPLARGLATWWPVTYVFEWANPVLHDVAPDPTRAAVVAPLVAVVVALGAALVASGRDHRSLPAAGQ